MPHTTAQSAQLVFFFIFTLLVCLLSSTLLISRPCLLGLFSQTGFPAKLLSAFPIPAHFASPVALGIPAQLVQLSAHIPVFSYPAQARTFSCQPWAVARGPRTTPGSSNQYTPWLQLMQETLQGKLNFITNSFFKNLPPPPPPSFARKLVHSSHTWAMKWQRSKGHFFIDLQLPKKGVPSKWKLQLYTSLEKLPQSLDSLSNKWQNTFPFCKGQIQVCLLHYESANASHGKGCLQHKEKNHQPHSQAAEHSETITVRQAHSTDSLMNVTKHY